MTALKLDLDMPLGGAGTARLAIDIGDVDALTPASREFLADTVSEFTAYAAGILKPPAIIDPPTVHDPGARVLAGVTGSRTRDEL